MPIAGPKSRRLFAAAQKVIPGGVNSPVRAWKRLDGKPLMISSGKGAWITDADDRRYVDYVLSWGPLIHGHAHGPTVKAVRAAAGKGLTFGAPIAAEAELARLICAALPSIDQVRMVSSGTEATMSALRLARAATGRDLVIKCDGCYHGHADYLLVAAGSGCATLNQPDSAGVPAAFAACTLSVPYNDLTAMAAAFKAHKNKIAAVIIEPVAGNMGLVLPRAGWLAGLRTLCDQHGALLVFDEVMTGFRTCWGGWQRECGITPDLTCLGKVVGGGMPLGAYGGRRELMRQLAPEGPCYQAGTLSGNPVAVAAGLASLSAAAVPGFYERVADTAAILIAGLREAADRHGQAVQFAQAGTMWGYFFSAHAVVDYASAAASDTARWATFFTAMARAGVYLAPSPFEGAFISAAHGPREIKHTLEAAERAFATVKRKHG